MSTHDLTQHQHSQQQQQHPFTSTSLPKPPRSGNIAPSQTGANAPTLVRVGDGKKVYNVRNVTFEVDEHYDVIKAIGLGAYGLVCSAIDLRYVQDHPFYQRELLSLEEHGGCVMKTVTKGKNAGDKDSIEFRKYTSVTAARTAAHASLETTPPDAGAPGCVSVPTLRYDPYQRQKLSNGVPSPYVAIKKVPRVFNDLIDGKRVLRETKVLQQLRGHENIIRIHDLMMPRYNRETFKDIYIVSELLDTDLHLVLKSGQALEEGHLQYIMYQLLKSLAYVHSFGAIHRDLKPGNLLLTGSCDLKVCDFGLVRGGVRQVRNMTGSQKAAVATLVGDIASSGPGGDIDPAAEDRRDDERAKILAKRHEEGGPILQEDAMAASIGPAGAADLTDYVITRYYRPPELLIMSNYSHEVDLWSAGCIMAEILIRRPVFPGKDSLSQLTIIAQTTALANTPSTPEDVDMFFKGGDEGRNYLKDLLFRQRRSQHQHQHQFFDPNLDALENLRTALFGPNHPVAKTLSRTAIDLLYRLLSFDPRQRLTALDALRHPFFKQMYSRGDEQVKSETETVVGLSVQVAVPEGVVAEAVEQIGVYYESDDEDESKLWEFDQRELAEPDLRTLFWDELAKCNRRKTRLATAIQCKRAQQQQQRQLQQQQQHQQQSSSSSAPPQEPRSPTTKQ